MPHLAKVMLQGSLGKELGRVRTKQYLLIYIEDS